MELTHGHLLAGRVAYAQPRDGYRTGIEPVLLAASVPAQPGDTVLEAGTGAGAGLLCLSARVGRLRGGGIEIDPAMADLARGNLAGNRIDGLTITTGDVTALRLPPVRHAFANPPWHDPRATPSPIPGRRLAKQRLTGPASWVKPLADHLEPGGTLTMIVPAASIAALTAAMQDAGFTSLFLLRLLPFADRPPKLAILQARDAGNPVAPPVWSGDLVLHAGEGGYSEAADEILRGAAPTPLATISAT